MRIPRQPPNAGQVLTAKGDRLATALSDDGFLRAVKECNYKYLHYDQLRVRLGRSVDVDLVWAIAKMNRVMRYKTLDLGGHGASRLCYTVPDVVQQELMLVDQQLAGMVTFDDSSPLSASQRERFVISALREEAIASSMLEGAATTRRDATQMLRTGRRPRTRGERMVVNNYQAIQFVRENRLVELSPALLQEVQAILTEGTLDSTDQVGRFRTEADDITVVDVRDNEIMHRPPPARELEQRLDALCRFANAATTDESFIHPVVRACVLHFQIGFDHPFCDGNGRTARAVFYWSMLRSGYWMVEFLPISRLIHQGPAQYQRAFLFCETDDFDVTYFLKYKTSIIGRARQDFHQYVLEQQNKMRQARQLSASDPHLNHRQRQVVLQATRDDNHAFSIAEHQGRHAISYATARNDLLQLAQRGYLTQNRIRKRFEFRPGPKIRQQIESSRSAGKANDLES